MSGLLAFAAEIENHAEEQSPRRAETILWCIVYYGTIIQVKNITKKFPTVTALDGISFTIREKEFFGLLRPNGAGKTTLINLLVGYLDPEEGEILVGGEKVTRDNLHTRKNIGLVPQSLALYLRQIAWTLSPHPNQPHFYQSQV